MHLSHLDLLIYWLGGGFVVVLAWAALLGQALIGPPRGVRPALGLFALVGVIHPVAALATIDLVRLGRQPETPHLHVPAWSTAAAVAITAASLLVALALWLAAGGTP